MGEGNLDAAKLPSVCIIYYIFIMSNYATWDELESKYSGMYLLLLEHEYVNPDDKDSVNRWEMLYEILDQSYEYVDGYEYI